MWVMPITSVMHVYIVVGCKESHQRNRKSILGVTVHIFGYLQFIYIMTFTIFRCLNKGLVCAVYGASITIRFTFSV